MIDSMLPIRHLAGWSPWAPFADPHTTPPTLPGVYLFRLPRNGDIVYVGMAGERAGSGRPQGLRGRLAIYRRGRGAVSGFGEAALDRALGDAAFVEDQLRMLNEDGPRRAKDWARDAIAWVAPEVCWATTPDARSARALEKKVEPALEQSLWNRAAVKARTAADVGDTTEDTEIVFPSDGPNLAADTVFTHLGFTIDLDRLYAEMWKHSVDQPDGTRLFDGAARDVPALKRLIADLFGVPVEEKVNAVNNAVRSACRDRLHDLGWATKHPGRSPRYDLHRVLTR